MDVQQQPFLGKFALNRHAMYPPYGVHRQLLTLTATDTAIIEQQVFKDKSKWLEILQKGNYKLSADKTNYAPLYQKLTQALEGYLGEPVSAQTQLDFFLFDKFDQRFEKEPSGFIHNDWGNFTKCIKEFAKPNTGAFYQPENAIALVLPIALPQCGSGLELYDVFHGEGVSGKDMMKRRETGDYELVRYSLGESTLFCPYQFHSGAIAKPNTLKDSDRRIVLVAFLIRYDEGDGPCWHMFRMCKGATLEYEDKSLYAIPDENVNESVNRELSQTVKQDN